MVAFPAATVIGALFVGVAVISSHSTGEPGPIGWIVAEQLVPLYGWAILAPALVALLHRLPVTREQLWPRLAVHFAVGPLVAIAKLVASAPLAVVFIWGPRDVPFGDGFRWILANRVLENTVLYWMLVAVYHAIAGPARASLEARREEGARRIALRTDGRVVLVDPDAIDRVGVDGNYVLVHVGAHVHRVRDTLSGFEARLPANRFLRIHRSALVNIDRIREVQPWFHGDFAVVLRDGTQLISGRTYRDRIRGLIMAR
jgi:hypothetical protein